jgi:hypothetical protein
LINGNITGEPGKAGQAFNVHAELYSANNPLPDFATTEIGDAYIFDTGNTTRTSTRYDLYWHGVGGTDWSIFEGWTGMDGKDGLTPNLTIGIVDLPFSEEFSPLTKFIYEKWQYVEVNTLKSVNRASKVSQELVMYKDWHLCVAMDVVSQPVITDNKRFDHQITFNEASVDSQKRIVDNIAVTYKLQDVSLESKPNYDVNKEATFQMQNYPTDFMITDDWDYNFIRSTHIGKMFEWAWATWRPRWQKLLYYQPLSPLSPTKEITLPLPILKMNYGKKRELDNDPLFSLQGLCSISVLVTKIRIEDEKTTIVIGKEDENHNAIGKRFDPYKNNDEAYWNAGETTGIVINLNNYPGLALSAVKYEGGQVRGWILKRIAQLSIFNSRSVDEYINAISSYVSNIVQLGGIIDEWVSPKSSSADHLVYNDVAEIHTTRNIIEIVDMEVKKLSTGTIRNLAGKGKNGESSNGYIFGYEIYQLLGIIADTEPNKGLALYYNLGDNKIQGLSYRLPDINGGTAQTEYSIKRILGQVFKTSMPNIKVNDFIFHVVYRTKDTLRSNQVRPDLRKYLMTSKHDKVPQANQFRNQTDVVVDSVKFGNNVYGDLIRTGNTNYTKTEWHDNLSAIKQSGDLYDIRGEWFYVSKVKNTYYANHVISEVEFSKDFNRLSQIIGIPSEPRFYEISEQSNIKKEKVFNDYIVIGTEIVSLDNDESYIRKNGWNWIKDLLFGEIKEYPKYAITVFKNDSDKDPIVIGNESFLSEFCHALGTDSIHNTLTISWGMEDNFSAGTTTSEVQYNTVSDSSTDNTYTTMLPQKYPDVFGRADLVEFAIINNYAMQDKKVQISTGEGFKKVSAVSQLPNNPITNLADVDADFIIGSCDKDNIKSHTHGVGLLKDNREAIHFNYKFTSYNRQ